MNLRVFYLTRRGISDGYTYSFAITKSVLGGITNLRKESYRTKKVRHIVCGGLSIKSVC